MTDIQSLTQQALADIAATGTLEAAESLRVALLGKSGSIRSEE
ncbi:MAG: phenylalanine--tRNA ligase subunit alpha, partial [Lysobacter sp.]